MRPTRPVELRGRTQARGKSVRNYFHTMLLYHAYGRSKGSLHVLCSWDRKKHVSTNNGHGLHLGNVLSRFEEIQMC